MQGRRRFSIARADFWKKREHLSADFLSKQEIESLSKDIQFLAQSMLKSIEGSTLLLEKVKKLGKMLSEKNLRPVDLVRIDKTVTRLGQKWLSPQKQVNEEEIKNCTQL